MNTEELYEVLMGLASELDHHGHEKASIFVEDRARQLLRGGKEEEPSTEPVSCGCAVLYGRPPPEAVDVERFEDGHWIPDDGKPGRAFSGRIKYRPFAWFASNRSCWNRQCPNGASIERTANRFGAANWCPLVGKPDAE